MNSKYIANLIKKKWLLGLRQKTTQKQPQTLMRKEIYSKQQKIAKN